MVCAMVERMGGLETYEQFVILLDVQERHGWPHVTNSQFGGSDRFA